MKVEMNKSFLAELGSRKPIARDACEWLQWVLPSLQVLPVFNLPSK